jgi:protoporphyrinogen oxidase
VRAAWDLRAARLDGHAGGADFESFAVRTYGETIARLFLLDYSEKVWGRPGRQLSPRVAGARLKGLDLRTFLTEALLGARAKTRHLDGEFLYPRLGIGMIAERFAEACGRERIFLGKRVTAVGHERGRVRAVSFADGSSVEVGSLLSTLPLPDLVSRLDPPPPDDLRALAATLRIRHIVLVALVVDRPRVLAGASVYFPSPRHGITRASEPKSRSAEMAPADRTALVVEIPCFAEDPVWSAGEAELSARAEAPLVEAGWLRPGEVKDVVVKRCANAYPCLDLGCEARVRPVLAFLEGLGNLRLAGRCARFTYTHIHDVMKQAREIVA